MSLSDYERENYHSRIFISEKAQEFLDADLGKYLVRKMEEDIDAVIEAFQGADPTNVKEITALQVRLKTALAVAGWLSESIEDGYNALNQYIDRKDIEKEIMER